MQQYDIPVNKLFVTCTSKYSDTWKYLVQAAIHGSRAMKSIDKTSGSLISINILYYYS